VLISISDGTLRDQLVQRLNSLKSFCFGCKWSVGSAHPTALHFFTIFLESYRMLSELFLDFIFGLLLIVIFSSLYVSFWFLPSPFNTSELESLFSEEDSDSLKSFLVSLTFVLISFVFQTAIPLGCVGLKRFFTSQISILDVLIICTAPAICLFCITIASLWTSYTGERKVAFTIDTIDKKGFKKIYSSLLEGKHKNLKIELIEEKELGSEVYEVSFTTDQPAHLPINLMGEILPIGGLLAICLSGGLIGYLLDG
jgi:hypothetical protein